MMTPTALRKVLKASELKNLIDLPEDWKNKKLNVFVAPVETCDTGANISRYFGSVKIDDPDRDLNDIRSEWNRI